MAIRRTRYASLPPVFGSTKTSRSRSYDMLPSHRAMHLMGTPLSRADKTVYTTRAEDYLNDRVSNAGYFSNSALEVGYDTARQSRNRDACLLREATNAIVSSESFATPQTSVAARRVARGQSMAHPRATSVPPRPLYPEAAIIASKMDMDYMTRRPRSEYAARKYRTMQVGNQENIYARSPMTSGYYASQPPLPKLTERKAIRTDDGYSRPKNLLSWQHRLDAKMKPADLLYQPSGSFSRIRQQVRMAQEGMDRHRQMLDRYLPEEGAESSDAAARVLRRMAEMDKKYPVSGGSTAGGKRRRKQRSAQEAPF